MKILAIFTGAMAYDGITNSVFNYYKAMDKTGMQIDIVSSRSTLDEMKSNFEQIGCHVYRLEYRDKSTLKYFHQLKKLMKTGKYDIVHVHGNSATLAIETTAAWLSGCKVRIVHSRNSFCEHTKADKLLRPLMYATYTDGFACGQKAGEWLFKKRPFTIIQNGKDIDRFLFDKAKREKFRKTLNASDDEVLLGHVGLFHTQKNHEFLIDVFQEICKTKENYRLVLIGEGDLKETIRSKVKSLGLEDKVVFLGRQTNVNDWLQALDIMVFPSLFEGMPNVVIEWQISGLPSYISDNITRECNITGNVTYLPLDKGAAFWAKQIMDCPVPERDGYQASIKETYQKAGFDITLNAAQLKEKYRELLQKRKCRS